MKVLIIEDNQELARNIHDFLAREGYICEVCGTIEAAREKLGIFQYDCILLDIGLPDGNGIGLLNTIRAEHKQSNVFPQKMRWMIRSSGWKRGQTTILPSPFTWLSCMHASGLFTGGRTWRARALWNSMRSVLIRILSKQGSGR